MSRIKALMLGMLAVFAIGAIASASASAAVWEECLEKEIIGTKYSDNHCEKESGTGTFGWMPIPAGSELKITSKGATQLLELQTNPAITITCKKVQDKGALLPEGKDTVSELVYGECTINIAGCAVVKGKPGDANGTITVQPPIKTKLLTLEISGKLLVEDEFKPSTEEEVFVELEIGKKENAKKEAEGACGVLPVKVKVKGNAVAMTEGQNLSFEGTGTLTAAGIAAKYLGLVENVLEDGKLFRPST